MKEETVNAALCESGEKTFLFGLADRETVVASYDFPVVVRGEATEENTLTVTNHRLVHTFRQTQKKKERKSITSYDLKQIESIDSRLSKRVERKWRPIIVFGALALVALVLGIVLMAIKKTSVIPFAACGVFALIALIIFLNPKKLYRFELRLYNTDAPVSILKLGASSIKELMEDDYQSTEISLDDNVDASALGDMLDEIGAMIIMNKENA